MAKDDNTIDLSSISRPNTLKDRYEVEREIGRGGMSIVYIAKDLQLAKRKVVVKVLLEESNQDEWVRRKFLQEMEALSRIDHPGVVGVFDFGDMPDGKQFLVMQFVEGSNLRKAIPERGMAPERAANLIRQIGSALMAAHDKDVLHRDMKPENIMVQTLSDGKEHIKLIDFGIAGIKNSAFGSTGTKIAGSLAYMAPEHFSGEPTAASDQFATAVIAFEMLTGRKPWDGPAMTRYVDPNAAVPPSIRQIRADLPVEAEAVLNKALSFRAQDRYGKIGEFTEALAQALVPRAQSAGKAKKKEGLEVAHVLFADLAGYSTLPMEHQRQYLRELQQVVRNSPAFKAAEAEDDVVSLPTGDGMALAFFGDPTAPARCSIEIAQQLRSFPHLKLRMGIHSGPVYRMADINTNSNVAGGGINMAQRVMDAADAGHILVSKSVADTLVQIGGWPPCLFDLGEYTVKHGVKIHLYNLVTADSGIMEPPSKVKAQRSESAPKPEPAPPKRGLLLAVAVVAAAGIVGFVAWMILHKPAIIPPKSGFNYSIWVQRFKEGKPDKTAFQLAKEIVFENGYGIAVELTSITGGHFYVMNEGLNAAKGLRTLTVLHPRGGTGSEVQPGQTIRIPEKDWARFDEAAGRENLYVVWSKNSLPLLESLKALPAERGFVELDTPQAMQPVTSFVSSNRNSVVEVRRVDELKLTEVRSTADILIHEIPLEHQ